MSSDQPDPHEEERMSSDQPAHDETNVEPRTMRFQGVPSQESEHVEVDAAVSPPRTRPPSRRSVRAPHCSSSSADRTPAPASCSTTRRSPPGGTPTPTSSSTT